MKKYLFGFFAIVLAVGFSAFTNVNSKNLTTVYFIYDPGSVSEGQYETTGSWAYSATAPDACFGDDITCIVSLDPAVESLTLTSGNETSQFATFLANKSVPNLATGATTFVNGHTSDKKISD